MNCTFESILSLLALLILLKGRVIWLIIRKMLILIVIIILFNLWIIIAFTIVIITSLNLTIQCAYSCFILIAFCRLSRIKSAIICHFFITLAFCTFFLSIFIIWAASNMFRYQLIGLIFKLWGSFRSRRSLKYLIWCSILNGAGKL